MTSGERMVVEAVLPLFWGLDAHPEEWVTYCNLIADKFRDSGREYIADRITATRGDWPPQPNTRWFGIAEPSVVMVSLCLASSWSDRPLIPEPAEDNRILREVLDACIVSGLVASRVSRPDVYSPATGPTDGAIRDDRGQIIAVTRLIRSC